MAVGPHTSEIAKMLRGLDIPVNVTKERGPYKPGINVWRFERPGDPSPEYSYRGTLVTVMYEPQTESEEQYAKRTARVREALLSAYPDRWRPLPFLGDSSSMLIEDPDTLHSRERAAENAKRISLGWKPLHEIGK